MIKTNLHHKKIKIKNNKKNKIKKIIKKDLKNNYKENKRIKIQHKEKN